MVPFQGRGFWVTTRRYLCFGHGRDNPNRRSVESNNEHGYDVRCCGTTRHHSGKFRDSGGKPQGAFAERGKFTAECWVYQIR